MNLKLLLATAAAVVTVTWLGVRDFGQAKKLKRAQDDLAVCDSQNKNANAIVQYVDGIVHRIEKEKGAFSLYWGTIPIIMAPSAPVTKVGKK